MNLLIASVDLLPKIGGISLMTHHLANALVDAGHGVVVLGPAGSCVPREYVSRYQLLEDCQSRQERRSGPDALVEDERIRKLFAATIAQNGVSRVILLHPFYYAIGALDACRAAGIPCSVYFHGLELRSQLCEDYPPNFREFVDGRPLSTLRERVLTTIGMCDEILVNSSYTGSLFDGFDTPLPVRVTGCGIPDHEFSREVAVTPRYERAAKRERQRAFGLSGNGFCLGFIGRLVPAKRVERLLGMCRACPDLCAIVVGGGPLETELRSRIGRDALDERVKLVGQVSESQKWLALRAVDFACLLSEPNPQRGDVEGFGIALLEGAAAGAVPVTSGTGGMTDIVEHHQTGVVAPVWDADAAQVLVGLADNEDSMSTLVAAARAQLRTRFTWGAVARNLVIGWT